ncbi:hypothetical protein IAD21_02309 [Abditibacteriota bacterium]|nr:hypothetical protein IAD21_02309 [Abditibacteriota bacterium]
MRVKRSREVILTTLSRTLGLRPRLGATSPFMRHTFPIVLTLLCALGAGALLLRLRPAPHAQVVTDHPQGINAAPQPIKEPHITIGDPLHPETLPEELQTAYKNGERSIVIRPGTYTLPRLNRSVFLLDSWKDVAIHATGVTLISSEVQGASRLFELNNCNGVVLDGPTLTQAAMSFYQGNVVALEQGDGGKKYVIWKPDAGYPIPAAGDSKIDCFFADPTTKRLKPRVGDFFGRAQTSRPDGTFQVDVDQRQTLLSVGDKLVGRYGFIPFKVLLFKSRNCTVSNVTVMQGGFSPIREDGLGGGGNHILNCRWAPGPASAGVTAQPLVSSWADGFHSTFANPGPDIENCSFDGIILDDPFAIHGIYTDVIASKGQQVTVKNADHYGNNLGEQFDAEYAANPQARFYTQSGFVGVANVKSTQKNADGTVTLNLDADLKVPVGAKAINPQLCGSGFKILNCQIRGTRSRGIVAKADDGLIAGNLIEDCGMSAVKLGPEYFWDEGDYARGVRIENNKFLRNGEMGGAAVFVHGEGAQGNHGIIIQNNLFESNYDDDIDANWTQGLTVQNNTFDPLQTRPAGAKVTVPMVLSNNRDVNIRANTVQTPQNYASQLLKMGGNVTGLKSDLATNN